jgi:hypothetical protein
MGWSRNALASVASGLGMAACLVPASIAAQDAAEEKPAQSVEEKPAQSVEEALREAAEAGPQDRGTPAEQFRDTLKQIDALQVYNAQMNSLIASQEAELESITAQMGRVEVVERSVTPLMLRMVDALEEFVKLDLPFQIEERTKAIEELKAAMNQADLSAPDKYRRIMEAYQIENEYGRTIDAYRSTVQKDGKELTVDFLRFGRIALVYQSLDESQMGVWNNQTRSWEDLDSSFRSTVRQGLRIARKQAAPDLVRLPLPAAEPAQPGGAS